MGVASRQGEVQKGEEKEQKKGWRGREELAPTETNEKSVQNVYS